MQLITVERHVRTDRGSPTQEELHTMLPCVLELCVHELNVYQLRVHKLGLCLYVLKLVLQLVHCVQGTPTPLLPCTVHHCQSDCWLLWCKGSNKQHMVVGNGSHTHMPVLVQMQCVELLLLLGQVHQAAGTPLTALPYVLSCLLHSTDLHMDLLVSI